jgi:hypothetical protein
MLFDVVTSGQRGGTASLQSWVFLGAKQVAFKALPLCEGGYHDRYVHHVVVLLVVMLVLVLVVLRLRLRVEGPATRHLSMVAVAIVVGVADLGWGGTVEHRR